MERINGIPVFGTADPGALSQIETCRRTADHVALMADNHKGYAVPIGGVVAYENAISPSGVGYDIACGNKAVRLDVPAEEVRRNIVTIMDDIARTISFGVGRDNNERVEHEIFDKDYPGWTHPAVKQLKRMAQSQLGTVGSGNHYVDILEDEKGRIWVGVHFGSRGLGHRTATWFLDAAGAKDGMDVEPCVLPTDGDLAHEYIACMELAGAYAYAGRDWVCARVAAIIGAPVVEEVHNHHNYAWREEHGGRRLWVVRKGATPAFPGQRGFVGGSMGDISVIIEGVENEFAADSLYSTVHGAGRVMGRMEAKGKKDKKTGEYTRAPRVTQEMMREWINPMGVVLRGAGVDEAPQVYKRLPDVLAAHEGTIKVIETFRPLGVAMAGADIVDPYKD